MGKRGRSSLIQVITSPGLSEGVGTGARVGAGEAIALGSAPGVAAVAEGPSDGDLWGRA